MKYFIIHSGSDYDTHVKSLLQQLAAAHRHSKFVVLTGGQSNWIDDATAKIRQSDKVIFIVGDNSYTSDNINNELAIAMKEKKLIYVYKLSETARVNEILNKYSKREEVKEEVEGEETIAYNENVKYVNAETLQKYILADESVVAEQLVASNADDKETLFEQYKMFVKTSEDLVKRKQTVNSFYLTLNSVIIGAIVSVLCAMPDIIKFLNPVNLSLIIGFVALIGLVICYSWISLLNSYSDLNASKMKIITTIEEQLALNLYQTEWSIMTQKIGKKKYKSFSKKERFVAYLFGVLYLLLIVLGIVLAFV